MGGVGGGGVFAGESYKVTESAYTSHQRTGAYHGEPFYSGLLCVYKNL